MAVSGESQTSYRAYAIMVLNKVVQVMQNKILASAKAMRQRRHDVGHRCTSESLVDDGIL
jgi:hypothetical protein